jgi:hypothetical protein
MKASPEACPACGIRVGPGQEYCLECGARIVSPPRESGVGRAWERKLGRYPGDWIWASLLLLLVAAGSATAGIVAARDTGAGRRGSQTLVATSPIVAAPPVTTVVTAPETTTTPAKPPARSRPKPRSSLIEWPARDGFTIVISSIPARGAGLKDATATAKAVIARGLRDVGVLVSSRFASLHPGYYVVFSGIYSSLEDAQTAVSRVTSKYPNAYARQITR